MNHKQQSRWVARGAGVAALSAILLAFAPTRASIPGTFVRIDAPGAGNDSGQGTTPRDINGNGDITGSYKDADGAVHGFVRHKDGTFATFDAPGAAKAPALGTHAQGINNDGEIVGYYDTNPDAVRHGFVRHKDGTFASIDPEGSLGTVVQCINARGDMTGNYVVGDTAHAFLRTKEGNLTTFDPPESFNTAPQDMNDNGDVTGYYGDVNNGLHGFLRHQDGTFEKFDSPDASVREGTGTSGMYLNNVGEITGYYTAGPYKGLYGFLRRKDGTIANFIPPGAIADNFAHKDADGYVVRPLTAPMGLTEDGEIAGYFGDEVGVSHGFLRHRNGAIETFDAPGANKDSSGGTMPQAINKAGDIVGYFFSDPDAVVHGFLLRRSGGSAAASPAPPGSKPPAAKAPKAGQ